MNLNSEDFIAPEIASDEYVKLEEEYNKYGDMIKSYKATNVSKKQWRKKRKEIRAKQNLLYHHFKGTGWVQVVQDKLGLDTRRTSLYKRTYYSNQRNKKEE